MLLLSNPLNPLFEENTECVFTITQNVLIRNKKRNESINKIPSKKEENETSSYISPVSFKCEMCGETKFINDEVTGDIICNSCGYIISEKNIFSGKEWRAYNIEQEKNRSRVGAKQNIFLYDNGLSTVIDNNYKDIKGNTLTSEMRQLQQRLLKTEVRYKNNNTQSRNYSDAMSHLNTLASTLNISKKVKEEVAFQYKKLLKKQALKGKIIRSILIALIYIIQAKYETPFSISFICNKCDISESEMTKYCKKIYEAWNIKQTPIVIENYLNTIHNLFHFDEGVILLFSKILYKKIISINSFIIQGKDPIGIAASIYYLAANLLQYNCTQHQICHLTNLTDVTLRNRYREFVSILFGDFMIFKKIINSINVENKKVIEYISKLLKLK